MRLALLAAMETCWVYAILAFFTTLLNLPRILSPLSLFLAYWVALALGRVLPRLSLRWGLVQLLAIGIGLITLLGLVRVDLIGESTGWFDISWLPRYIETAILFKNGTSAEFLATVALMYVFVRGLGLGQRPLTLWFIGFQFRLGIIAFFLLLLGAGMLKAFDATMWIFGYFFLALFAVALARMDEMGSDLRLGPRWAATLFTAVGLVLVLGFALVMLFRVDLSGPLMWALGPLGMIIEGILYLILIPVGFLAQWLFDLLQPLFALLRERMSNPPELSQAPDQAQKLLQANTPPAWLVSSFQILFVAAVLLVVGYLLARALNRRMSALEEETYIRESLGPSEELARESAKASKPRARKMGSITAESIRRIYAALVARASAAGLPRRIAETPYEFLPRLAHAWPDEADQVRTITEAYVAVHYGEHEADKEEVEKVQGVWREAEKAIRLKT